MMCICGIPEITLLGKVDDWEQIRERIEIIAEFDLEWWTASLAPILDEFVRAAQGSPKVSFFREIYQPREAYGGDTTVGWAARLYPYLSNLDSAHHYDVRNPLLATPVGWREKPNRPPIEGIKPDRVPKALGACRITVDDRVQNTKYAVLVQGGLSAIEVNAEGRLIPLACWSLVEDRGTMRSVIESIRERADVRYQLPEPPLTPEQAFHELGEFDDSELRELRDAFGELRMFDAPGEWRLREPSAQVLIQLPKQKYLTAHAKCLIDLPDDSILALTVNASPGEFFAGVRGPAIYRRCLVHLRANDIKQISPGPSCDEVTGLETPVCGPTQTPHFITRLTRPEIPIVADSLTELLERALGCDGKLELEPIGFLTNDD